MSVTVLLPGSYDPVTRGHLAVIDEASRRYDSVFVVLFVNPDKEYLFSLEDRLAFLRKAVEGYPNVVVDAFGGLVVDYAKAHGVDFLFKGVRNETDLAYETKMADWNAAHGVKTVFYHAPDDVKEISSTELRACLDSGKPIADLVAPGCEDLILTAYRRGTRPLSWKKAEQRTL